ncbi:hypothetical protein CfE428DRAFT_5564 [Chthoniobacter flavus Ellin428]|uniref:Uncharacterized protein n=1 Tax=Chthoniobacter flavus Ellin428 TaxID=497964 RepID=B4D9H4_9BACT|nr:hypothetical protein [Chthoniobacter flavus]EDY16935.1 hypothetical protein CfE428DRAFT_5564 [Chthoniobacter flavus Ellin428]TCO87813.1 hypothetical protein EV701_120112 [Chthoniobacter flavus]
MPREFLIYSQFDGRCYAREREGEPVHGFSDILAALEYVRRECGDAPVSITALDCTGRVAFTTDGQRPSVASRYRSAS